MLIYVAALLLFTVIAPPATARSRPTAPLLRATTQTPPVTSVTARGVSTTTAALLLFSAVAAFSPPPSFAQIPSFDDYNVGSGAKVVEKSSVGASNLPSSTTTAAAAAFSPTELKREMAIVDNYVQKGQWDEVLKTVAPVTKVLGAKAYGYGDSKALGQALGVSPEAARGAVELSSELQFALGQLSDFALSKRVLFFNKEDLAQINLIKSGERSDDAVLAPNADDVDEARGYLREALAVAEKIEGLLN